MYKKIELDPANRQHEIVEKTIARTRSDVDKVDHSWNLPKENTGKRNFIPNGGSKGIQVVCSKPKVGPTLKPPMPKVNEFGV